MTNEQVQMIADSIRESNKRTKSITPENAMRQASLTAREYLRDGIAYIDEQLGEGYAENNPDLLAAFIRTAAQDYHTAMVKD